ncbi:hypothetical protein C2E23DRAFT_884970 [Lenzites betulinus]|nr:hypothetical protein C2E23DRAFT_884970 [Lenzites betulinus]
MAVGGTTTLLNTISSYIPGSYPDGGSAQQTMVNKIKDTIHRLKPIAERDLEEVTRLLHDISCGLHQYPTTYLF